MARKTIAMLEAELAEQKQINEDLRNRPARARFGFGMWPNTRRETPKHPEFTGSFRFVVPPEKQAGDYIWLDVSLWNYDEEHCPLTFTENPPALTASISPCTPDYEAEQEAKRVKSLAKSGRH